MPICKVNVQYTVGSCTRNLQICRVNGKKMGIWLENWRLTFYNCARFIEMQSVEWRIGYQIANLNILSQIPIVGLIFTPLCALVVRVSGYRSRSIPGATWFSEKWVWKGALSASRVQLSCSGLGIENTAIGIHRSVHVTPSICKSWH
jgi:hypothetical protein